VVKAGNRPFIEAIRRHPGLKNDDQPRAPGGDLPIKPNSDADNFIERLEFWASSRR
jgi:hypothetical protein